MTVKALITALLEMPMEKEICLLDGEDVYDIDFPVLDGETVILHNGDYWLYEDKKQMDSEMWNTLFQARCAFEHLDMENDFTVQNWNPYLYIIVKDMEKTVPFKMIVDKEKGIEICSKYGEARYYRPGKWDIEEDMKLLLNKR